MLGRDLPEERTGQYPSSYPPETGRNEAFYWVLGIFREEITKPVRKAPNTERGLVSAFLHAFSNRNKPQNHLGFTQKQL